MNIVNTLLTGAIFLCSFMHSYAQTDANLTSAITEMETTYRNTYDIDRGIVTCQKVLEKVEKNTAIHFDALFYLGEWYLAKKDKEGMYSVMKEMKEMLETNTNKELEKYKLNWLYLRSEYSLQVTYNYEEGVFYSIGLLLEAKKNPQVAAKFTWQTAKCFGLLAQNDAGEQILKLYKLLERPHLKTDFDKCKYYLKIGMAQIELEAVDKAKNNLTKAVNLASTFKEKSPKLYDYCRYQLARYYREYDEEDVDKELMLILRNIIEGGNRDYKYIGLLGRRLASHGNYDEALEYLQEAINQLSEEIDTDDYEVAMPEYAEYKDIEFASYLCYYKSWSLRLKGLEYIENGNREKGIELLGKAIAVGESGLQSSKSFINEMIGYKISTLAAREVLHLVIGGIIYASETLYQVTQKEEDLERLFYYIEQRKCVDVHHAITPSKIPEPYATQLKKYEKRIEDYELLYMRTPDKVTLDMVDSMLNAVEELEEFKKELLTVTSKVRLTEEEMNFLSLKDIQNTLDEKTVFIQYSIVRSHIYGILITKSDAQVELLGTRGSYEPYINNYIKLCESPLLVQDTYRDAFIQKSNEMYNLFIEPFEEKLEGKERIIVSPERNILSIPFETFLKENTIKPLHELAYLIHRFEINYQYSATLHQKIHQRPAIQDYSALTFAPVFSSEKSMGSAERSLELFRGEEYGIIDDDEFVPLPNTLTEVKSIKSVLSPLGKVTTLTEKKATKKQLIKALSDNAYQFIHIASHSVVNYQDPRLSMIACYQHDEKDNLYFSNDITNLPIRADLVILSSCESGIGRIIDGEGLIGLSRSFIIAGARNALFTLWKVNDQYSSELMIDFYKNYTQTQDYTKALHEAKLKMLTNPKTAAPRYWAPFVLMGE